MSRYFIGVLAALFMSVSVNGQYDPLRPPNTFQSDDNPHYWKNKKPHAAYWQQDVYYAIKAELDDQEGAIRGVEALEYTNNSPDELDMLVFHLYQNAFVPTSYANALYGGTVPTDSTSRIQRTEVRNLTIDGMRPLSMEIDNTLMIVRLASPVRRGETVRIECEFETFFGDRGGRMKSYEAWGFEHYNAVHWYPRIAVYDATFGWTMDQHLGSEFYGDFGAFDVELTLPAHYVVGATGYLLNRSEVLPEELREQLDVTRFKDKAWNSAPSIIIEPSGAKKTWKYHAENVHDFAWTADPTYRIGEAEAQLKDGSTVMCYSLVQEPHAARWQNAASYAAEVIELFSKDFGTYAYPKIIVADARDGMEYPMLTLDGGGDPGYRSLIAHEVGHNWFFGMVGNNETYRAALDEGFTQFLTGWAMTELEGDSTTVGSAPFGQEELYGEKRSQRDMEVYLGYYFHTIIDGKGVRLNTHSDHFESGGDFSQVYSKTGTMLYNLQYVLGDSLFQSAMKHYFDKWSFCHPYFQDFRQAIIEHTDADLNWFFDQWLESEATIDYAVKRVQRVGENRYRLVFERKGMQMPIDFQVIDERGGVKSYHIPNSYFIKETDAEVLPKWYGWNEFNELYEVELETDARIKEVVIDPSRRLADVYQLDNASYTPISMEWNDFQWNYPTHEYAIEWNPGVWYNSYDGVRVGFQVKGDYFSTYHELDASVWIATGALSDRPDLSIEDRLAFNRFNYTFSYTDPLRSVGKDLSYTFESRWMEGLFAYDLYVSKELPNGKTRIDAGIGGLYRPKQSDLHYLIYSNDWNAGQWNNFSSVRLRHSYRYSRGSRGVITSELRSPFLGSDYQYGYLNLEAVNDNKVGALNVRTRVFGQFGTGNNWAPESRLFASGANPEEMMQHALSRSQGIVPGAWYGLGTTTGNFQVGGGLNLRGYNNYLVPETNSDSLLRFGYAGNSGLAFNTELEFDDLLQVLPRWKRYMELKTYLFADAGVININRSGESFEWSSLRMDAGLGASLEIKRWGPFSDFKPLQIRWDMPLFLNRPPADQEFLAFRWLIGIQRAF